MTEPTDRDQDALSLGELARDVQELRNRMRDARSSAQNWMLVMTRTMAIIAGAVTLLLTVFFAVDTWRSTTALNRIDSTRKALSDELQLYKHETDAYIRKRLDVGEAPELALLDGDGRPIPENEEVALETTAVSFYDEYTECFYTYPSFSLTLKNMRGAPTGALTYKVYTSSPIVLEAESTDENGYDYEQITWPGETDLESLPVGLSTRLDGYLFVIDELTLDPGTYPILLKVYYGARQQTQYRLSIDLKQPYAWVRECPG